MSRPLCSPILAPFLYVLAWALNKRAVYVYDFDGERHLALAYELDDGVMITRMLGVKTKLMPDGSVRGVSWRDSWRPVFPAKKES